MHVVSKQTYKDICVGHSQKPKLAEQDHRQGRSWSLVLGKGMSERREGPASPPACLCVAPRAITPESLALPTLPLTAVSLVFSVLAVVLFVAGPSHGDAPPAWAGKVIGWTLGFPPAWFVKETSVRVVVWMRPASSQPRTA